MTRAWLCAGLLPVIAGCATIMGGLGDTLWTDTSVHTMIIASTPSYAEITITDERGTMITTGVTPKTVFLRKSGGYWHPKSYQVQISKSGYETQTVPVVSLRNWWYIAGNAGLLIVDLVGLVGYFIVDPMYGYMYKLSPEHVVVTLKPEESR